MKMRSDFVTNSSSSVFIIGKYNDDTTLDSVYNLIRSFFILHRNTYNEVCAIIQQHPECGLFIEKDDTFESYSLWSSSNCNYKTAERIQNRIAKELDWFTIIDSYSPIAEWYLTCETYADYLEYWDKKLEDTRLRAPFLLHKWGSLGLKVPKYATKPSMTIDDEIGNVKSEMIKDLSNSLIQIAFTAIKQEKGKECEVCFSKYRINKYVHNGAVCTQCKNLRKKIIRDKVPENKAGMYLLGTICIITDDDWIPSFVMRRLEAVCNYKGKEILL